MTAFISAYRRLHQSGELNKRVVEANQHLTICDVCAWRRPVDRTSGQFGVCRTGMRARSGLLIRHLVLPKDLAGTSDIVRFLAEEISKDTYLNLMDQYRPDYNAHQFQELDRRLTRDAYIQTVKQAHSVGLNRLDQSPSHLW